MEVLKPQCDTEVNEAALLVQNHTMTLSLGCGVHITMIVVLGLQVPATASYLECSFVLRPCCLLQNPCFLRANSL